MAKLAVMTKFLAGMMEEVEKTDFKRFENIFACMDNIKSFDIFRQFPPTYVNGEFVYVESKPLRYSMKLCIFIFFKDYFPFSEEEKKYWNQGKNWRNNSQNIFYISFHFRLCNGR